MWKVCELPIRISYIEINYYYLSCTFVFKFEKHLIELSTLSLQGSTAWNDRENPVECKHVYTQNFAIRFDDLNQFIFLLLSPMTEFD